MEWHVLIKKIPTCCSFATSALAIFPSSSVFDMNFLSCNFKRLHVALLLFYTIWYVSRCLCRQSQSIAFYFATTKVSVRFCRWCTFNFERNFNLFAMLASCAHFHLAWSVIILSSLDDCCESTQPPSSLRCSKYWRLAETASIIYEYCVCVHPNAYHAHTPHALAETNENRRRK